MDHRINVFFNDKSQSVVENLSVIGGTNIRALKGPDEPMLFYPREEQKLLQVFGEPTSQYSDIWNVIQYNSAYPIYVASATDGGRHGGVLVTKTGTEQFTGGKLTMNNFNFSAIPNIEDLGTGDASTTNFSLTIADSINYNSLSIDILANGTSIDISAVDAGLTETLTSTDTTYSGTGTYTKATGEVEFTFDTAPASGIEIEVKYTVDRSDDVYCAIYNSNREVDDTAVKITYSSGIFTISTYYINDDGTYSETENSPYEVTFTEGSVDGFGINNYITDVFDLDSNKYLFQAVVNENLTVSTFTDDTTEVDLTGGTRGDWDATIGYDYFKTPNDYPVDIFFDASGDAGVVTILENLANNYQKYATYLFGMPNTDYSTALTTKDGYSLDNKKIKLYYNYFKVRNLYNDGSFYTIPMGRIAYLHAVNKEVFYQGRQCSWINEAGVGGQLGSGFISVVNKLQDEQVKNMENEKINPIIWHNVYGVMVTSDYTTQIQQTDYSSGGHVGLANYIVKSVVEQVLPYQIDKPNDDAHRNLVRNLCDLIVSGPASVPGLLNWYAIKCDAENNNDQVRAREEFVIEIAVQFTPYSRKIKFTFTNYGQTYDVSEAFV